MHTQSSNYKRSRNVQLLFVHDSVQYSKLLLFVLGRLLAHDHFHAQLDVLFDFASAREILGHTPSVHVRAFDTGPEVCLLFVFAADVDYFDFGQLVTDYGLE